MVIKLRRRLSYVRDYLRGVGRRSTERMISTFIFIVRAPRVHQKSTEERVKHVAAVLNIGAGACFGVGVLSPAMQAHSLSLLNWALALVSGVMVLTARHALRYIPLEASKETTNG